MSNISIYTPSHLTEYSNFVNNFLDSLLENYCENTFKVNTQYNSIPTFTLNSLICNAYPNYYEKSVGLYAHKFSTDVKVIYESNLHDTLVEALEHKVSRLFVKVSGVAKKLRFTKLNEKASVSLSSSHFIISSLNRYLREVDTSVVQSCVYELYNFKMTGLSFEATDFYVYKPDLDSVKNYAESIKESNFNFFNKDLKYFSDSQSILNIKIALSLYIGFNFQEFFKPEHYKQIEDRSSIIAQVFLQTVKNRNQEFKKLKQKEKEERLKIQELEAKQRELEKQLYEQEQDLWDRDLDFEYIPSNKKENYSERNLNPIYVTPPPLPVESTDNKLNKSENNFIIILLIFFIFILFLILCFKS